MRPATLIVAAGAAALLVVATRGDVDAQTVSTFNLNSSITKDQPIVTTVCRPVPTSVGCPGDTKTQMHILRGDAGASVFLGLSASGLTPAVGVELAPGNRQSWDVGGPLVKCIVANDGGIAIQTVCGRGP